MTNTVDYKKRFERLKTLASSKSYESGFLNTFHDTSPQRENIDKCIIGIKEFYSMDMFDTDYELPWIFHQLVIILYRDANKVEPMIAQALLHSLFKDYPDTSNTKLYAKFESIVEGLSALNACYSSDNYSLYTQVSKKLMQSINEFINAILGFFIISWKCGRGNKYSVNIFKNRYGSKYNEFKELTNGDDGIFYLVFRIGNYHLRNALAHDDVFFDREKNVINYNDREDSFSIGYFDYVVKLIQGAVLPKAYVAALNTIYVNTYGSEQDKNAIDSKVRHLFTLTFPESTEEVDK